MLEKLVHASSVLPPNQHYLQITIPNGTSYRGAVVWAGKWVNHRIKQAFRRIGILGVSVGVFGARPSRKALYISMINV